MHLPRLVIIKLITLIFLFVLTFSFILYGVKDILIQNLPDLFKILGAIFGSFAFTKKTANLIGLDLKDIITKKKIDPQIRLYEKYINLSEEYINRQRNELIKRIKDKLEREINQNLIILGLVEDNEVVDGTIESLQIITENHNPSPVTDEKIYDKFQDMNQAILILGEPGSGKTTTLLRLARQANKLAEISNEYPVPVIFNLSSWTSQKQISSLRPKFIENLMKIISKGSKRDIDIDLEEREPLTLIEWLADEYVKEYKLKGRVLRNWIENEKLLILLDGLNEVKPDHKESCVLAINEFLKDHGITQIAICSRHKDYRHKDYDKLIRKLDLRRVKLQPPNPEQINLFLERMGKEFEGLRNELNKHPNLMELAKSPLMLSIMTQIYRGGTIMTKSKNSEIDSLKDRIFDAYVDRMFDRKNLNAVYPKDKTIRWLSKLARKMTENPDERIVIQYLPFKWLNTLEQLSLYYTLFSIMTFVFLGSIGGIILGLIFGLTEDFAIGLIIGIISGIGTGFIYGMYFSSFINLIIISRIFISRKFMSQSQNVLESLQSYLDGFRPTEELTFTLYETDTIETTGKNVLHNFTLQLVLYVYGFIPWDMRNFLNYASDLNFLDYAGNEYKFFHPLIQEYFDRVQI